MVYAGHGAAIRKELSLVTEFAWFLLVLILLWAGAMALWQRHWRKERQRKWDQLNAYWDLLISGADPLTVARPPWLGKKG